MAVGIGLLGATPACGEDATAYPVHRSFVGAGGENGEAEPAGSSMKPGAPGSSGTTGTSTSGSAGSSGSAGTSVGAFGPEVTPEPDTGAAGATAGETGLFATRNVFLTSDNIDNPSTDNARMDTIAAGLQSLGVTAARWGLGPGTHDDVLFDAKTQGGLIVDIYGGACAGTLYEMGTDWYKDQLGTRKVFTVFFEGADITGLDWLPRAWDDDFSPSGFTGLAHPDEYLHNNGYDYIYSSDLNFIIQSIATQARTENLVAQELAYQSWVFHAGTSSDIDGDGKQDVCGRRIGGVWCYRSENGAFDTPVGGPPLSDGQGWWDPSNFSTIRLGDVNGDGLADLCARSDTQVVCYPSTGSGFGQPFGGPELSDAGAWNQVKYYSTFQLADVNGDGRDDVCVRGLANLDCHKSTGKGFEGAVSLSLPDSEGWDRPEYGGTLRMGDINGDGKADVCARGVGGMRCWVSDGEKFTGERGGPAWSDEQSWGGNHYEYWSTIRLADINGDGMDDLCARSATSIVCSLSTGTGFGPTFKGPELSDAGAWNRREYFSTIRFGDVDGDGRQELCARGLNDLSCWKFEGTGFVHLLYSSEFSNANGWDQAQYYRTITLADFNGDGKADVCARRIPGYTCWPSDGKQLGAPTTIEAFSDAAGGDLPHYYATLRLQGVKQ